MRLIPALVLSVAGALAQAADPAFDPATAEAVLRINDARWVEREATRLAAAMGRDPAPLRAAVAGALYHARSLEGIDTARPALVAWRSGTSPMVAVIPLRDRRRFLDDFGVMPAGEAPLVRTGDRDGTTVWSQNHAQGLREYRLLVVNDTAYLGRSLEDCRALAARPLVGGADPTVALTATMTGAFLQDGPALIDWPAAPWEVPRLLWLDTAGPLASAATAISAGTKRLSWECRPMGNDGEVRLTARIEALPETPFAQWLAAQRDHASRLSTPLQGERTAAMLWGSLVWQGQAEAYARDSTPAIRAALGPAWIPAVAEAWTTWWALWERSNEAAWALEVTDPGQRTIITALEQPRSAEHAAAWNVVAGAVTGIPGSGEGRAFQRNGRLATTAFEQVLLASDRHLVAVDVFGGQAARPVAEAVSGRLALTTTPSGQSGILMGWCDVARLARLSPHLDAEIALEPAPLTLAVTAPGLDQLEVVIAAPLRRVATVLARSSPPTQRVRTR
jgi:hypothetical protein